MSTMSMREAYGRALAAYGATNPRVIVLDVDTSSSTFSNFFAKQVPERFFNIGIAEPCMIDVAVGLALSGKIVFANGFAALLALRALEQIRTCVAYARTNVKIAASYAGVSDFKDGPTHHTITDIAVMRALPEMTVIVPADANEAAAWVPVIAEYDGPVYLRISRAATIPVHDPEVHVTIGKGITLRQGQRRDDHRRRFDGRPQSGRRRSARGAGNWRAGAGAAHPQAHRRRSDYPGGGRNRRDRHRRGAQHHRRAGWCRVRGAQHVLPRAAGTGRHPRYVYTHRARARTADGCVWHGHSGYCGGGRACHLQEKREKLMRIAVINETSAADRNADILAALEGRGHT